MSDRRDPLRLALFADPTDEDWQSMAVAADGLAEGLAAVPDVQASTIVLPMPRLARRLPVLGARHAALNADRLAGRFGASVLRARRERSRFDAFHIADHVYANLVTSLPAGRTGVYCHDLDAFAALLDPVAHPRPAWFRAMTSRTLDGLRSAAVVFHSTQAVRAELLAHDLVDERRLVWAPPGVSAVFSPGPVEDAHARRVLSPLQGRPYLLHVGSALPRKRVDLLFDVYAELADRYPDLWLVQRGAELTPQLQEQVKRLGFSDRLLQPPPLDRQALAGLYRGASAVLVTSEAEGFGLPVIEALACGAAVVASDIPVLNEVGGTACTYREVGDVDGWVAALAAILDGAGGDDGGSSSRLAQAGKFSWEAHARTVARAYQSLLDH